MNKVNKIMLTAICGAAPLAILGSINIVNQGQEVQETSSLSLPKSVIPNFTIVNGNRIFDEESLILDSEVISTSGFDINVELRVTNKFRKSNNNNKEEIFKDESKYAYGIFFYPERTLSSDESFDFNQIEGKGIVKRTENKLNVDVNQDFKHINWMSSASDSFSPDNPGLQIRSMSTQTTHQNIPTEYSFDIHVEDYDGSTTNLTLDNSIFVYNKGQLLGFKHKNEKLYIEEIEALPDETIEIKGKSHNKSGTLMGSDYIDWFYELELRIISNAIITDAEMIQDVGHYTFETVSEFNVTYEGQDDYTWTLKANISDESIQNQYISYYDDVTYEKHDIRVDTIDDYEEDVDYRYIDHKIDLRSTDYSSNFGVGADTEYIIDFADGDLNDHDSFKLKKTGSFVWIGIGSASIAGAIGLGIWITIKNKRRRIL